jgi:DNA-binding beta-propeller fold protein YncE
MATKPSDRILDWASGGTATDPGGAKEAAGWLVSERPPANWWNWILSSFGQWLTWAETSIDDIDQILSDGYQIASAIDSGKSVDVSTETSTVRSVSFAGSKMYVCSLTDAYQYDLGDPYNPNNAIYDPGAFDLTADTGSDILHECIRVNAAGTRMYSLGATNDRIYEWELVTPYDITSASFNDYLSLGAQDSQPYKMDVSQDGTKIYVFGQTNNKIFRYSMSPAWGISTASFDTGQELSTSTFDIAVTGVVISNDGTQLLLAGDTSTQFVGYYELATPYDLTSAFGSPLSRRFDMTGFTTAPSDLNFSPSGRRMYIVEDTNDVVAMFYTGHMVAPEDV